jgi:peptidylprolyl isomerase
MVESMGLSHQKIVSQENFVIDPQKGYRWPLAVMVIVLIFTLTGCKSSGTPAVTIPIPPASTTTVASIPIITLASTAEPYILEGAITTTSGLQYLEERAGDGASPSVGDVIKMDYSVSLTDGTEIYSTYSTNQPATALFGRDQLLPGWEEGVGLMKAGGKAKLVLPPELAFGEQGYQTIPPNSQIIMEVELLSVKPAPTPVSVASDKLLTMANGVQYADLILGDGAEAISNTTVTTEYAVWVVGSSSDDFVASSEDNQPVTFIIGQETTVFPGWEYGVVGMKVGGKRLLIIPPDLALGSQSSGLVPANSTLKMEITLTDVKQPKEPTQVDEKDYITTASGLKYYDIQVGTGITPTVGQTVVVNYVGWLENGTQFDSSYDRGETYSFVFGTGQVIDGWDEGLASMKVGGIRQLVIPPALGYGDTGSGSTIPGGATLIFEVELVGVNP